MNQHYWLERQWHVTIYALNRSVWDPSLLLLHKSLSREVCNRTWKQLFNMKVGRRGRIHSCTWVYGLNPERLGHQMWLSENWTTAYSELLLIMVPRGQKRPTLSTGYESIQNAGALLIDAILFVHTIRKEVRVSTSYLSTFCWPIFPDNVTWTYFSP